MAEGPNGIFGTPAQSEGTEPWSGAVTTVLPDPPHANVALIATVNGGIWRTIDLGAATPRWTPESGHAPSLSIASLSFDPTAGAGDRLAIAGIGHRSAFGRAGRPLTGLLESTDGGRKWTSVGARDLSGADVGGASIRGKVIVATSRGAGPGVWVSTDGGARFKPALPGPAYDPVGDPRRPTRARHTERFDMV